MHKHFLSWQFVVYVAGGVLSALVDIGIMQLLIGAGLPVVAAASTGFACGLLLNYAFHARVTFGQLASRHTFGRYLCLVAANYLLTIVLVSLGQWLAGSPLLGKLVSLPVVALNGYLLGKLWVFRNDGAAR